MQYSSIEQPTKRQNLKYICSKRFLLLSDFQIIKFIGLTRVAPVICLIKLSIIIACSVVGAEEVVAVVVPVPGAVPVAIESLNKENTSF